MKSLVGYDWPEGRSKQISYISRDHHIHEFCVGAGGTWQHTDLTTLSRAPLAQNRFLIGFSWPEGGTKQVAFLGHDGHVHELHVSIGGKWQHTDLSAITGAPPAIQVTAGYSWDEGDSKQIIFVGDDGHIHELWVEPGREWRHIDLTIITNSPLPGSHFMVGYEYTAGRSKQLAYVGRDGHIHELFMVVGDMWRHIDLSVVTNAPRATDLMVGYDWPDGRCKQLTFVSEDHHLHELYMVEGTRWSHADLSAITNAPAATGVLAGYAWPEGHSKQVIYAGQDGRIHEVYAEVGRMWLHKDLTALAHAPMTPITCLDGYKWSAGDSKQVAYVGDNGEIRELWMARTTNWQATNLSELVMATAIPARF